MTFLLGCLSQVSALPIVYSFGSENATALNRNSYLEGFELRFEGDTDDVVNGVLIENLQGTVHLEDGRTGNLLEPMSISLFRGAPLTYSAAAFFSGGSVPANLRLPYQLQSEIRLSSGANSILTLYSGITTSVISDIVKATDGYELATDFEFIGLANHTRIPRDFGAQFNRNDGVFVDTSLGQLVSFDAVTFTSTLAPAPIPSSLLIWISMGLLGCVRRWRSHR